MDAKAKGSSSVADFFAGKSVFLTGVTGFVGKAILEKLLRSCPGIGFVYVLVREAKGKSANERLADVLTSPLFQRIRLENPVAFDKVMVVEGDVTVPELGLSEGDKECLQKSISVVIHCAASVKFNDPFRDAIHTNVVGAINVLALATQINGLQAFVYISTAYSNCNQPDVREIIYSTNLTPNEAVKMAAGWTEDETSNANEALEGRPNFYTLSKCLAEQLVESYRGTLPVCIVRPSIVSAALHEPVAGWIDNYNGATGVLMAGAFGLLRCVQVSSRNSTLDIIPVDFVVNLTIAAAWFTATNTTISKSRPFVFHCCSGGTNRLTLAKLVEYGHGAMREIPFKNMAICPGVLRVRSAPLFHVLDFLLQRIPCQLMDFKTKLLRKKPFMMRLYWKMSGMLQSLSFFITHDFNFSTTNSHYLNGHMSGADQKLFNFNEDSINWESYFCSYADGIRRFLLRESEEDLEDTRNRRRRLHRVYCTMKGLVYFTLFLAVIVAAAYFFVLPLI